MSAATQESEAAASEIATRDFTRVALLTLVVIQVAWVSFLTYLAVGLIL